MELTVAEEVMGSIYNWFEYDGQYGDFVIKDGALSPLVYPDGTYVRIVGSAYNDGLHLTPITDLKDECFTGKVMRLAIPKAFEALVDEIAEYQKKNPVGAYTSESFGGYSYTKPTSSATGVAAGWADAFRSALNKWRKLP